MPRAAATTSIPSSSASAAASTSKKTYTSPAKPAVRRSLRLNGHQAAVANPTARSNIVVQIHDRPELKRRKVVKADVPPYDAATATNCFADSHSKKRDDSASDLRISCVTRHVDLARREKALLKRELDFQRRSDDLDGRISRLSEKEEKASRLLSQIAEREAKAILFQLEEHFTCPLCYEIMACPISLNPGQCGHTFCALCVLKWFFSRLHKACGGWHESVDCPICRSLLIITPDRLPRPDITFPFTPNRIVDTLLRNLIDRLADTTAEGRSVVKEEEDADEPGLTGISVGKEKERVNITGIDGWRDGGPLRTEWIRREREGREKIGHITKSWSTLTSQEFIDLKAKLGV